MSVLTHISCNFLHPVPSWALRHVSIGTSGIPCPVGIDGGTNWRLVEPLYIYKYISHHTLLSHLGGLSASLSNHSRTGRYITLSVTHVNFSSWIICLSYGCSHFYCPCGLLPFPWLGRATANHCVDPATMTKIRSVVNPMRQDILAQITTFQHVITSVRSLEQRE